MRAQPPGYWFRSTRFHVEPGEDDDTNPGIYGKQVAAWLAAELRGIGYPDTQEVPEDWGWAVVCAGKPFYLYVACSNLVSHGENGPIAQPERDIVWHCHAAADTPLFARFRNIDVAGPLSMLDARLGEILRGEAGITLLDEP